MRPGSRRAQPITSSSALCGQLLKPVDYNVDPRTHRRRADRGLIGHSNQEPFAARIRVPCPTLRGVPVSGRLEQLVRRPDTQSRLVSHRCNHEALTVEEESSSSLSTRPTTSPAKRRPRRWFGRLARFVAPFEPFREVLADEGFDALLAQVFPDHLELALGVAAETVQRDDDGQAVVFVEEASGGGLLESSPGTGL